MVAHANKKINEWKDTAWPFLDDVKLANISSSDDEKDNADSEDEYAKLGAASPK